MNILPEIYLWTRKFSLHFGSHRNDPDPDSIGTGSTVLGESQRCLRALILFCIALSYCIVVAERTKTRYYID